MQETFWQQEYLHLFLYTRCLVAKHLMAKCNALTASQKVASKQITDMFVKEKQILFAVLVIPD